MTDAIVRGEPWVFVAEKHQHLRSPLTPSQVAAFYAENTAQKAAAGKKLREQNLKRGDKAPETAPGAVSGKRNESAEKVAENLRESGLQVGRRTLTGAKKVYEESPQLHQMVSDGEIKVKTAEAALKLPEPVLSAAIKGGPDAVHSAVANARLSHSTKESKECELRNLGVHESIVALMLQFRVAKKEVSSLVKSAERMRLPCRDKSTTKETMLLQLQKTVRTLEFASKAFGSILATAESSAKSASTT
ncbi:MAG: hypothetical protein KDA71_21265 [Planctomycetales bacterium]|nr:hypothetical protein [Planctomycetales bacterium]